MVDYHFTGGEVAVASQALDDVDTVAQRFGVDLMEQLPVKGVDLGDGDDFHIRVFRNASDVDNHIICACGGEGVF